MALSFSPPARNHLKNLAVCFSLANLCLLRRWYDLENLKERAVDYYRAAPASPVLLEATLITAVLLTAVFWLAWRWVERDPTPVKMKLAQCGFLLISVYPLESVRLYWNQEGARTDLGSNIALLAIEGVLILGAILAMFGNTRVVFAAKRVALALTLLFPALMIDFAVGAMGAEPASVYQPKPSAPMFSDPSPRRVVWILFDELDEHMVFELHKPEVPMPEMDRLRAESFFAGHAVQTAGWTTQAVPSMLSGMVFRAVQLQSADGLRVYPPPGLAGTDPAGMDWGDAPNVFKRARVMRMNASLVGWHHPYCRIFGDEVVRCMDLVTGFPTPAVTRETAASEEGLPATVLSLFHLEGLGFEDIFSRSSAVPTEVVRDEYTQARQQRQYFQIRDRAYQDVVDPRLNLVFLHFPIPHPLGLYDRKRGDFQLSPSLGYADNLALVDRTLGEIRKTLEQAGLWKTTSILVTSDHGFRPDLWRGRMGWTGDLDRWTGGKQWDRVPLIVKIGGESKPAEYDKPFSNAVCGDIALAILAGEIQSSDDVARWLDRRNEISK